MPSRHRFHLRGRVPSGVSGGRRAGVGAVVGCVAAALLQVGTPDDSPVPRTEAPAAAPAAATRALDPVAFDTGGCVALGPTAGDRGRTVFLDAGHGAPDPGTSGVTAAGRAVDEKDLTLPVALRAADELRARGYRVALSRTTDDVGLRLTPDDLAAGSLSAQGQRAQLAARARCANLAGASALVSIHFDAFSDPEVRGAATLYEPDRPFGASNARFATVMQRHLLRALGEAGGPTADRGVIGGDASGGGTSAGEDLVVLGPPAPGIEPSAMPGVLVEPLFLTNPADATLAAGPEGQAALAKGITRGVEEFLQPP